MHFFLFHCESMAFEDDLVICMVIDCSCTHVLHLWLVRINGWLILKGCLWLIRWWIPPVARWHNDPIRIWRAFVFRWYNIHGQLGKWPNEWQWTNTIFQWCYLPRRACQQLLSRKRAVHVAKWIAFWWDVCRQQVWFFVCSFLCV